MLRGAVMSLACLLAACTTVEPATPSAEAPAASAHASEYPAPPASIAASSKPAPTSTAEASPERRYVSESGVWSITVPSGWEIRANANGDVALIRGGGIAEVLVSPSWGLGLEQLKARTVQDLSAWPWAVDVEAELVRLPAGDAVWATLETRDPQHGPATFTVYAMDDGNRHYAISVRGPGDGSALWLAVAKELAESFDINDEVSTP